MAKTKVVVCPYCGEAQPLAESCRACRGDFAAHSRRASRESMGPWFVREPKRPFGPGHSHDAIREMVERGTITKYTILRGPTTRQFWTVARHVPGVAHLLGYCHACDVPVAPDARRCPRCQVSFEVDADRDRLGITEIDTSGSMDRLSLADMLRGDGRAAMMGQRGPISAFASDEDFSHLRAVQEGVRRASRERSPELPDESATRATETGEAAGTGTRIDRLTLEALEQSLRQTVRRQQLLIGQMRVALVVLCAVSLFLGWRVFLGSATPTEPSPRVAATEGDGHGERAQAAPQDDDAPSDQIRPAAPAAPTVDVAVATIERQLDGLGDVATMPAAQLRAALSLLASELAALRPEAPDPSLVARMKALRERIDRLQSELELREFLGADAGA